MTCLGVTQLESDKSYLGFISSDSISSFVLFCFSSSHVDRGAGDRTGRKKREGCWGGGKGWKFPEKRQGKSRGAENEVIRGAANNYPKKWLKIFLK